MSAILTKAGHLFITNSDNMDAVIQKQSFDPVEKDFGADLQKPVSLVPGEVV